MTKMPAVIAVGAEKAVKAVIKSAKSTEAIQKSVKGILADFDLLHNLHFGQEKAAAEKLSSAPKTKGQYSEGRKSTLGEQNKSGFILPKISLPEINFPEIRFPDFTLPTLPEEFVKGFNFSMESGRGWAHFDELEKELGGIQRKLKKIFDEDVQRLLKETADRFLFASGQIVGAIRSIFTSLSDFAAGSVYGYLTKYTDFIRENIKGILNGLSRCFEVTGNMASALAYIFTAFDSDSAKAFGAELIAVFANTVLGISSLFANLGADILNCLFMPIISNKEAIEDAITGCFEVGADKLAAFNELLVRVFYALSNAYELYIAPGFSALTEGLTNALSEILSVFNGKTLPALSEGAKTLGGLYRELVAPAFEGIISSLGKIFQSLCNIFALDGTALGAILGETANLALSLASVIENVLVGAFGVLLSSIQLLITGLEKIMSGFEKMSVGAYNFGMSLGDTVFSAKESLASLWEGCKKFTQNLKVGFKNALNNIIDNINAFITSVNEKLNFKLPESMGGGGVDFSIPTIPKLYKGGIVTQPTLAMVGERGREAVMPLEQNTAWMDALAGKIAAALPTQSGDNRPLVLEISINGTRFGRVCAESINALQRHLGKTVLEVR